VVFNRQGLGSVTQQAVREQDTPVVLAVVLIVSFVFVLLSLLTDLAYPLLDPRIRVSQGIAATEN
jgi:peptide/nickel transport system permease protein